MQVVMLGRRAVGEGEPTYVIAEAGSNHDGSLERAKMLVDLAVKVKADAIKFQSFLADQIVSRTGFTKKSSFQARWTKPVYDTYADAEFPRKWHRELADYCAEKKIDFLSSSWDKEAVDLLDELQVPGFKIGSGDITNLPLLRYTAEKGRPIILATGSSTLGEVEEAINTIKSVGNQQILLLQCVVNYPSPIEQANIRAMQTLREAFHLPVGYSDHSPTDLVALGAVACGACIIEKHFTYNKTRPGPDHPHSMDPQEFASMVGRIRLMERALGSGAKEVMPAEAETRVLQRRGVFAKVRIPAGTVIKPSMLILLRPVVGLEPKHLNLIVGRKAKKRLEPLEPITWDKI